MTADAVGCGLYCKFCWVGDSILNNPSGVGRFYSPSSAKDRLIELLEKSGMKQLRISGGEPTIGQGHLVGLLDLFQGKGYHFILETNGILLGHDNSYTECLSKYKFLHVRVSLKGCNEKEFTLLTNAKPEGYALQIKSLKNLLNAKVSFHPSVMVSFSTKKSLNELMNKLSLVSPRIVENLETENLIQYPKAIKRLKKYGLEHAIVTD